jgi:hypothetical protein
MKKFHKNPKTKSISHKTCDMQKAVSKDALQMFTEHYGVSAGFPCNIYGKGL